MLPGPCGCLRVVLWEAEWPGAGVGRLRLFPVLRWPPGGPRSAGRHSLRTGLRIRAIRRGRGPAAVCARFDCCFAWEVGAAEDRSVATRDACQPALTPGPRGTNQA